MTRSFNATPRSVKYSRPRDCHHRRNLDRARFHDRSRLPSLIDNRARHDIAGRAHYAIIFKHSLVDMQGPTASPRWMGLQPGAPACHRQNEISCTKVGETMRRRKAAKLFLPFMLLLNTGFAAIACDGEKDPCDRPYSCPGRNFINCMPPTDARICRDQDCAQWILEHCPDVHFVW
jgi:hypothetical protein